MSPEFAIACLCVAATLNLLLLGWMLLRWGIRATDVQRLRKSLELSIQTADHFRSVQRLYAQASDYFQLAADLYSDDEPGHDPHDAYGKALTYYQQADLLLNRGPWNPQDQ